jgi:hypothetical protein
MCVLNAGRKLPTWGYNINPSEAYTVEVGDCDCLPDWAGPQCEHYGGICAPICRGNGCWGPSET